MYMYVYIISNLHAAGQSFPNVSELVITNGLPIPPLESNSSTPTSTVYQWLFPRLSLGSGLNLIGWVFQAKMREDSYLAMTTRYVLFTIWQCSRTLEESGIKIIILRGELNTTHASSIHKIEGPSPSLYYNELKEPVVTQSGDVFGIRGTNETLGIHFVDIIGGSGGWSIQGDSSNFAYIDGVGLDLLKLSPHITNFLYLPLVTPV